MTSKILVIGAGIGGLSAAALLAHAGYDVTVLEAQTYPGGCASTFTHKGFRFDSGATVVGGFQPNGPHALIAEKLNLRWNVYPHDPAWVVHLPGCDVALTRDYHDILLKFPGTERFWQEQRQIADLAWHMSAQGLPWPPGSAAELQQLVKVGLFNFPRDLRLLPFALGSVYDWLKRHNLDQHESFVHFLDGQLLISAQSTTKNVNALYGATALDLARQGVYHVEGGIGGIAETMVENIRALGGQILYRQRVTRIDLRNGRTVGVYATQGKRAKAETFYPADMVVANLTPWDVNRLLGENSPSSLQREVARREPTWGAFALHLGVKDEAFPSGFPDHHQILQGDGLGETRSLFMSISPAWDKNRAPQGQRAVTVTTHTQVEQWWNMDEATYYARKDEYAQKMIAAIDKILPDFEKNLTLILPGSPVTYQFYTGRHLGMVGGFPQTSLFKMRAPRTGIPNLRLVGDSIFPGQSTAGVTLGAMRVSQDIINTV